MKERYTVGEIARMFNISTDAVRYYDSLKILPSKRNAENKYRYYTREDLLCFYYLIMLKNLNLPLDNIRTMLNKSTLEYASSIIAAREKEIDAQIKELADLKEKIADYRTYFEGAKDCINTIRAEGHQAIIYNNIGVGSHTIGDIMEDFKRMYPRHMPALTFLLDKDMFLSDSLSATIKDNRQSLKYVMSLKVDSRWDDYVRCEGNRFITVEADRWLSYITKFYTSRDYSSIDKLADYVKAEGLAIGGPVFLRTISFRNNIDESVDYYEICVPLEG